MPGWFLIFQCFKTRFKWSSSYTLEFGQNHGWTWWIEEELYDAEEAIKRANTESERALKQQKQQLELVHEKAMLEAERKHDEEIRKIKTEQQQEIDRYQKKYLSLLEKLERPEQTSKE